MDCGSGSGIFLYFLQRHGFAKEYGVDLSPRLIDLQKSALGITSLYEDALQHLRNSSASFEIIAALDFLEHLAREEAFEFLSLAAQKIAASGRLFLQAPNVANPFNNRMQLQEQQGRAPCRFSRKRLLHCVKFSVF